MGLERVGSIPAQFNVRKREREGERERNTQLLFLVSLPWITGTVDTFASVQEEQGGSWFFFFFSLGGVEY